MAGRYDDRWERRMFGPHERPRYFGTRSESYSEGGSGFGGGYGDRFDERIDEDPWSQDRGPYRGALGVVFATPLTAVFVVLVGKLYIEDTLGDSFETR